MLESKKYKCPCCGSYTLDSERQFDICSICYWEDDNLQYEDPDYQGAANKISLNEARLNFSKFKVSSIDHIEKMKENHEE